MTDVSRRRFLGVAAGTALAGGAVGTASAAGSGRRDGWHAVESPTDRTLYDVARAAGRTYAVGGGGVVLARGGDGWRLLSRNGADGNGSNLRAAAGDGAGTVWIAGASGALAEIDAESGDLISHRAPDDVTNEFTAVAIAGSDGGATVYVADSSGHVHVSAGSEGGHRTWTHATPGSGAAIRGVAVGDGRVVAVDANASVFEASDGGATWNRIGVDDADGGFRDVAVAGGTVHVAGGKLWSDAGDGWGVVDPFDTTLYDLEIGPCGCVHAVGADGTVRHRPGQGIPGGATLAKWLGRWEAAHPTSEALYGIVLGRPHVAVGANGTIVER